MNPLKQLQSGLIVPVEPEKAKPPIPGMIKDEEMRAEINRGLNALVKALGLNCGHQVVLSETLEKCVLDSVEHSIRAIGDLCLGGFDWEVKT